jgi:PhnB protein
MAIKKITPYLMLHGNAAKAISLYEKVLGAKTTEMKRFRDVGNTNPEVADRVLHALLTVGTETLMVSDGDPRKAPVTATNVHVALDFDTADEMLAAFDGLSRDGQVEKEVHDTFWGAKFGIVTCPYGVVFMLNWSKAP